jgi:hypothetical protein
MTNGTDLIAGYLLLGVPFGKTTRANIKLRRCRLNGNQRGENVNSISDPLAIAPGILSAYTSDCWL